MKTVLGAVFAIALGFGAGYVWGRRDTIPVAQHRAASEALAVVRDSVRQLAATRVTVDTVLQPGAPVIRIVRTAPQVVRDTVFSELVVPVVETVLVLSSPWIRWDFGDETAAYTLRGSCNANVENPLLSYADYRLDVNQRAICPGGYRLWLDGGIVAGSPFVGASWQWSQRLRAGINVGGTTTESEVVGLRFGAQASYGLR